MVVNRQDALRRLNSPRNLVNSLSAASSEPVLIPCPEPTQNKAEIEHREVPQPRRGNEVPSFLRVTAGVLAHENTAKEVGEQLGIAPYTVHNYKHGVVGGKKDVALKEAVSDRLESIRETAAEKLMSTLGLITPEKMKGTSAKDLALISANFSRVVQNLAPQRDQAAATAQIIFYSPQVKEENRFKTIEV